MARICVLDDDLDGVTLIQRILSRKGHLVRVFTDGNEAVRYLLHHRVDLALVDSDFGGTGCGLDVLGELKRTEPTLRVIMLAQYPTSGLTRQAHEAGAADYCLKPIEKAALEQKVSTVLATGRRHPISQEYHP